MDIVTPLHLHYLKLIIFILFQVLQLMDDPIESRISWHIVTGLSCIFGPLRKRVIQCQVDVDCAYPLFMLLPRGHILLRKIIIYPRCSDLCVRIQSSMFIEIVVAFSSVSSTHWMEVTSWSVFFFNKYLTILLSPDDRLKERVFFFHYL